MTSTHHARLALEDGRHGALDSLRILGRRFINGARNRFRLSRAGEAREHHTQHRLIVTYRQGSGDALGVRSPRRRESMARASASQPG